MVNELIQKKEENTVEKRLLILIDKTGRHMIIKNGNICGAVNQGFYR